MESVLRATVDALKADFQKKMASFENDLQKASSSSAGTSGLAVEFAAFRIFITQTVDLLQQQIDALAIKMDGMEMQRRRKMLLFHGVEETQDENIVQVMVNTVKEHFQITDFKSSDIQRCHRMGRPSSTRSRPIIIKFQDIAIRDKLWFNKTKLKGSGVTLSEFLTKVRYNIFVAARERFGVTKCWTRNGDVYVVSSEGRHRVSSISELGQISAESNKQVAVTKTTKTSVKTRRTATKK